MTTPAPCACELTRHANHRVVLTGGPGAGKTAILELAREYFCQHVSLLPESASIVFGGGFWRKDSHPGRKAAQRAIFHVQRELEAMIEEEGQSAITLCDRGTLDGLAYWPTEAGDFYKELNLNREAELARYATVIHLRTPTVKNGYNHVNPVRIETAKQAAKIDERIIQAWEKHPRRFFIESTPQFLDKAFKAIELIRAEIPECCRLRSVAPSS